MQEILEQLINIKTFIESQDSIIQEQGKTLRQLLEVPKEKLY